jgi:hypothetical protein
MTIADLKQNQPDAMGNPILVMYGFKPPEYAVYRTKDRVVVQFADDRERACEQRSALAWLNPVRGEINGLVDGWRLHPKRVCKAERYDRRVGDALVLALEDDVTSGGTLLERIKQDILDERVATARFWYLIVAFAVGFVSTGALGIFTRLWDKATPIGTDLLEATMTGAAGAFFSIAIGIRGRTILPDLRWVSNAMDGVLRMIIGLMAGAVLMGLVDAGVVNVPLGDKAMASDDPRHWLFVLLVGFIAGFSERFVPDLLSKSSGTTDAPMTKPVEIAQRAPEQPPTAQPERTVRSEPEKDEDPLPEEGAAETCTIGIDLSDQHVTPDTDLPPASGGVAKPKAA